MHMLGLHAMTTVQVGTFQPLIFLLSFVLCNHVCFLFCSPFSYLPCPPAPQPTLPWFHDKSNIYSLKLTCSVFRSQLLSLPWGRAGTSGNMIWRTNTSSSIVSYTIYFILFFTLMATQQAGCRWQWRGGQQHSVARHATAWWQHNKQRTGGNCGKTTSMQRQRWHNKHTAATQWGNTMSIQQHNKATQWAHDNTTRQQHNEHTAAVAAANTTRQHNKDMVAAADTTWWHNEHLAAAVAVANMTRWHNEHAAAAATWQGDMTSMQQWWQQWQWTQQGDTMSTQQRWWWQWTWQGDMRTTWWWQWQRHEEQCGSSSSGNTGSTIGTTVADILFYFTLIYFNSYNDSSSSCGLKELDSQLEPAFCCVSCTQKRKNTRPNWTLQWPMKNP